MAVDQSQPLLLASRFIGCDLLLQAVSTRWFVAESRVITNKKKQTHTVI